MPAKKKKVIKKKNIKSYVIEQSGKRGSTNYVQYRIPKHSKKKRFKIIKDIENFATDRSFKMKNINILKDANITLAVQFENGQWASTSGFMSGDTIEMDEQWMEYAEAGRRYSQPVSFSIMFNP